MTPFDVLSRDLDVFAPHFLEASAGTGKTFAIEHLVTRQLLEGPSPLLLDQILVVTFTKAATRELKARIRRNLIRTKRELQEKTPSTDYLMALCEQGEDAIKAALRRSEDALICFDVAHIYTLHGFCHRSLKEFAFEAGVGLTIGDPEEQEHLALIEHTVKRYLKEEMAFPDYSPVQVLKLLNYKEIRKTIQELVKTAKDSKEIARFPTFGTLHAALQRELEGLPSLDAAAWVEEIERFTVHYKEMTDRAFPAQIRLFAELLAAHACTAAQFDSLLREKEFFLEKMHPKNLKVRTKISGNSALLEQARSAVLPYIIAARDPRQIFLRVAQDVQQKCQHLLDKQEVFSPDALLGKMAKAMASPAFVARVRGKYRAAIIDEFQDTDPIQWSIFQKLFLAEEKAAVCLVGDPKQSIYAFRNADIYTYLAAKEALGTEAQKSLDTNYRSTSSLVEALNLLFSLPGKSWMGVPELGLPLEIHPVRSGATHPDASGEIPLRFFVVRGKKGKSKTFPTSEMYEETAFPFIASEIVNLVEGKKVELHEIALLVKDRFQAQEAIAYLKKWQIPASFKRGEAITESIAYFALKELLEAVCSPHDMSKVKAALGGPLIQWTEEELNAPLDAKAKMYALHHTLREKGFALFYQALLNTSWGNSQAALLEELITRDERALLLNLRKLAELLIEEEMSRGLKMEEFCRYLEEISYEAHSEENRLKMPSQEEKGSVAVLTMHMSKGLEFDTVFALGVAARQKIYDHIDIKREGRLVKTSFDPEEGACRQAIAEAEAERMRQLYVALTRAKSRLYVPLFLEEGGKPIKEGEASPIELFFAKIDPNLDRVQEILTPLFPHIGYTLLDQPIPMRLLPPQVDEETPPTPLSNPHFEEERIFSFSSIAKKEAPLIDLVKPALDAPFSLHTLPLGTEMGQWLHLLFEKIFQCGWHHPLDEGAIAAWLARAPWPEILPWIVSLLKKPLLDFSLVDIPKECMQQEMEFYFPVAKGVMKGFADLVFEHAGKYYLLDWKSNYLGPTDDSYSEEKISEAMRHHDYFLQAAIYAEALKRFVKLFDSRPFSECFGGAIYYFIRGQAAYHFFPQSVFKNFVVPDRLNTL